MAVETGLLTIEDLERITDDEVQHELLYGKLIEMPPPTLGHSRCGHRLYDRLWPFVRDRKLGRVFLEMGFQLFPDSRTCLQPDLSFVSAARFEAARDAKYILGAPELAVETVSLDQKIHAYLRAGAHVVWVIYPQSRTIYAYRRDGTVATYTSDQILREPHLFPGWEMPVDKVFED